MYGQALIDYSDCQQAPPEDIWELQKRFIESNRNLAANSRLIMEEPPTVYLKGETP